MTSPLIQKTKLGPWEWTVWPTLPMPTDDWLRRQGETRGPNWLDAYHRQRESYVQLEQHNPLKYGWEQPPLKTLRALLAGTYVPGQFGVSVAPAHWRQEKPANDVALLGGNGSGKTEIQAKLAMEVLEQIPGAEARCFSQNEATSVSYIQKAMYRYLRPELRKIKKQGTTTKISYTEATGFSENVFVLPLVEGARSGSKAVFPTYKSWEQDRKSVEGGECRVLTWDEEAPSEMIETVRFRAHKAGGFILGGFTPVEGYTETVAQYIEGAVVLEVIPARDIVWDWAARTWAWGQWLLPERKELVKGCPPGHLPYVVQNNLGAGRRFAMTMPTFFNPYTNVGTVLETTEGRDAEHKLERLWGWPTRRVQRAFPNFGECHLVAPEKVPPVAELTIYRMCDPHGDRNWFMLWLGIDADGRRWIFREWPDAELGEWALPGGKIEGRPRHDGKPGPAQYLGGGRTFRDYQEIILAIEGWKVEAGAWKAGPDTWQIEDSRMDPRPAGTSVPSDVSGRTYLDFMAEPIRDASGLMIGPGLNYAAAPGVGIEEGKQLINAWLADGWNVREPVTPLNCPRTYVSRACANVIWSLRTWTGNDGEKGASKDPVDCLKMAAKMDLLHKPRGHLAGVGSWGGY